MNKEPRVSVRVSKDLKKRLEQVSGKTGIDEATLVRNCLEALINHIETEGEITFPLAVLPKSKTKSESYPPRQIEDKFAEEEKSAYKIKSKKLLGPDKLKEDDGQDPPLSHA